MIKMVYKNHRGEVSTRTIDIQALWFGCTGWHQEEQWLLRAVDVDKGELRDFALKDCDFRSAEQ